MAGSVNKVILIGNLGRDPEIRHLESGVSIARFSIATSETFTDNIVCWRGLAKVAESYLKKGMKVYIEGKLKTRSWQDENNQTKYSTEVVADQMTMLSRAEANNTKTEYPSSVENNPVQPPAADLTSEPEDDLPF